MRKIIALSLAFYSFASVADDVTPGGIQPYREYLSSYVEMLVAASCEQTQKGGNESVVLAKAAQGMKKNTESYFTINNSVVLGASIGNKLKEKGKLITKNKVEIDNCDGAAAFIVSQKDSMNAVISGMTAEVKPVAAKSETSIPNDDIYRTSAKALAELYNANEVAADDKIGGRKVEIIGSVQEITKNFTNDIIVRLESGNRFMPVGLSMEDTEKSQASKLKKGQKTVITCGKMLLFIGTPTGSNCTFN
jgi:hypothetical protein